MSVKPVIIATASDIQRIQQQSAPFIRRSIVLQTRVSSLPNGTSSLEELNRQIKNIEQISAAALELFQEMETFKNKDENREVFRVGAGFSQVISGFNLIQNGVKSFSELAAIFKRDDVPRIRASLSHITK